MSDVRDEMARVVASTHFGLGPAGDMRAVDAILERFDVVPKPAVAEGDLGRMMVRCWGAHAHSELAVEIGRKMLVLLDNAGLRIVRVDDER